MAETSSSETVNPDEAWFQPDDATRIEARQIARELDYDEDIALRLVMLGHDAQSVAAYLNPSVQNIMHPEETLPGLVETSIIDVPVPGVAAAARALRDGIRAGDLVAIYGDYDVDGQTSLAILADTIEGFGGTIHTGQANAQSGFGLSRSFVEEARDAGAKWLVTVDCGSTQVEPVRLAQEFGMTVIVVDHHEVSTDNTADFHLNPRLYAALYAEKLSYYVHITEARQNIPVQTPYDTMLAKLTDRTINILHEELGESGFSELEQMIRRFSHPVNTGSVLTWKFCAAMHLSSGRRLPKSFYGRPLYLAGLGAIADMAPCDDQEIRAFVRCSTDLGLQRRVFGNRRPIPLGIELLAEHLEEDSLRPDTLIRTRALCNLPKRTTEINPSDIQTIMRSSDYNELEVLIPSLVENYARLSSIRRDQMDPLAIEQVAAAAAARLEAGDEEDGNSYFAFAVIDGFDEYAGYTRMVANTLVRETGRPAIAFACKGEDEFGQRLYKWSGANGVVPEAKLGELIGDANMRRACRVMARVWEGEPAEIENIGGHTEVVSGVCTADNIENVKAAAEAWARRRDEKKKWRPIGDRKRPRVTERLLRPQRFRRVEREAHLLAPFSFPESPKLQVSVNAVFSDFYIDDEMGRAHGLMTLLDGTERMVCFSETAYATICESPQQHWETIVALGEADKEYYIGTIIPIEAIEEAEEEQAA